jgi:CheY-like chemotaxis protein
MKKILIVDDDVRLTTMLRKMLEAMGSYDVMTADSGKGALAAATIFKPDLAILDVMMPGMDGGEVASALKMNPNTRNVRILFLTSLVSRKEQSSRGSQEAQSASHSYLAKPVDPQELFLRVEALLSE